MRYNQLHVLRNTCINYAERSCVYMTVQCYICIDVCFIVFLQGPNSNCFELVGVFMTANELMK